MTATLKETFENNADHPKQYRRLSCSGADRGVDGIKRQMDVIGGDGKKVGVVDCVENGLIKLTKHDSPDGRQHFITTNWVDRVDNHVHLFVYGFEIEHAWKKEALEFAR